jgi:hypothetical protein
VIVGFGHNMGVGKDTAALALARDLGFRKLAFADPLRDLAMHADPLITSQTRTVNVDVGHGRLGWAIKGLGYEAAKRTYPEVRAFLQRLGYGARQVFGEDFWTNQTMQKAIASNVPIVISDVRFLNEAQVIKSAGGLLVKITRPGHHGDGHVSETELADYTGWDLVIENNGSILELEQRVVQEIRDRMPKEAP